jgi:hypothetical protein
LEDFEMKRLIAILLTSALLLATTACDNDSGSDNRDNRDRENNRSDTTTTPTAPDATTPTAPDATVGGIIQFGGIDWLVLDVQDDKAFVISEGILETRAYHGREVDITWGNSDIRAYLNGEFLNRFNADDRARIVQTNVVTVNNPVHGTAGGISTTDHVFLLSISDVNSYFTDNNSRVALDNTGTAHSWWLRSPGFRNIYAAGVRSYFDGDVDLFGYYVNLNLGIRPAMWISL